MNNPVQISSVPDWLTYTADIVTLLGFIGTIFVGVQTFRIKSDLLRSTRIPQLHNELRRTANLLLNNLKEWPDQENESYVLISKANAMLGNLEKKLPKENRSRVKKVRLLIDNRRAGWGAGEASQKLETLFDIHTHLSEVVEVLSQLDKDRGRRL